MQGQGFSAVVNASYQNDELELGQATSFTKRDGDGMIWDEGEQGWEVEDRRPRLAVPVGPWLLLLGKATSLPVVVLSPSARTFSGGKGNTGSSVVLLSTTAALAVVCFFCSSFWSCVRFRLLLKGILRSSWVLLQAHVMSLSYEVLLPYEDA